MLQKKIFFLKTVAMTRLDNLGNPVTNIMTNLESGQNIEFSAAQ